MHAKRVKEKGKREATQRQRAEKFRWPEAAPVDLDRYARRAGEIIAQGAARPTRKEPRRRR
jgi:hypothetical protein